MRSSSAQLICHLREGHQVRRQQVGCRHIRIKDDQRRRLSDTKPTRSSASSFSVVTKSASGWPHRSSRYTSVASISRGRAASINFYQGSHCASPEPTSLTCNAIVQSRVAAYSRMVRVCDAGFAGHAWIPARRGQRGTFSPGFGPCRKPLRLWGW